MVTSKPRNPPSVTRTTERGYFIRRKVRRGKKRRQKTTIVKNNPEKVVLGRIGDIEIYVYPKTFPDKVFFGIFPMSTYIEEHQIEDLLRIRNKIRWFFDESWTNDRQQTKGAKINRQRIVNAYNTTLNKQKEAKNPRISV